MARGRAVDLVVVDANLGGALAAAESLTQPSVVLLHSMYKTFVDTWFGEIWPLVAPGINQTRGHYGLAAADGWPAVFAGHDRMLSVVPARFDAPVAHLPETMRHFGFLVPQGSPTATPVGFPPGVAPLSPCWISSTTYQGQAPLLQTILDAIVRLDVAPAPEARSHWSTPSCCRFRRTRLLPTTCRSRPCSGRPMRS